MRALLWFAICLAAACSPPPVKPEDCFGAGAAVPDGDGFGVAGSPVTVRLTLSRFCNSTFDVTATVGVAGVDNLPVTFAGEATRAVTERDSQTGMTTVVTFTPQEPGAYHLTARFEPNLGLVQEDVFIAENHQGATAAFTFDSHTGLDVCNSLDVTEQGRLLCLSPLKLLERDGGTAQAFDFGFGARAGTVLWTWSGSNSQVTRWEETDAGFVQRGVGPSMATTGLALLPTADDALLITPESSPFLLTWDGGTLSAKSVVGIPSTAPPNHGWRDGDDYLLFSDGTGVSFRAELCSGSLRPDAGAPPKCVLVVAPNSSGTQPSAIASEPRGLWVQQDVFTSTFQNAKTLTLFKANGSVTFGLPATWAPPASARPQWANTPFVTLTSDPRQSLLLGEKDGAVFLQRFPDGLVKSVTPRWVTVLGNDNRLRVFER